MSTETAADILDVTPDQVARLCRLGRLAGQRRGPFGRWHVDGKAVRARRLRQTRAQIVAANRTR